MVTQHPGHIQILEDKPVVGFDKLVRNRVEEVAANVGDMPMVPP